MYIIDNFRCNLNIYRQRRNRAQHFVLFFYQGAKVKYRLKSSKYRVGKSCDTFSLTNRKLLVQLLKQTQLTIKHCPEKFRKKYCLSSLHSGFITL